MATTPVSSSQVSAREKHVLEDLAKLLRENGDKILDGSSCLSLTTASLLALNKGFRTVCDLEPHERSFEVLSRRKSSLYDFCDSVQFLHDIVQKTFRLKLLHSHVTVQGSINIGDFRDLRWLEIKKVPVHLLVGIQKLRPKLETLVCTRCVDRLQDLFETCGGDKSEAWSWSTLKVVVLSFNDIQLLDESLRLLPHVQLLDLSHNKLKTTEGYLHYLHDLAHGNFGFNSLAQVPSFTITGRQKIVTLILKNNNLDNIDGIEELVNLKHLDVADNCLSDHSTLCPLIHLIQLHVIYLVGNPLSYHPEYRLLTTRYLPYAVHTHVLLDDKKLSKSELAYMRKHGQVFTPSPRGSRDMVYHNNHFSDSRTSTPTVGDIYRFDQSGEIARTVTPKGKQKLARKRSKGSLRQNLFYSSDGIDNTDTGGSSKESSRASTPKQDSSFPKFFEKQHIETIRSQLGPKWLQSLPTPDQSDTDQQQQRRPLETDDDLYLTDDQGMESKKNVGRNLDVTQAFSDNTLRTEMKTVVDIHALNHSQDSETEQLGRCDTVVMITEGESSTPTKVALDEAENLRQMVAMCLKHDSSQHEGSQTDASGSSKSRNTSGQIYETGKNNQQTNHMDSVFSAYRRTSSEYFESCENESDPFIVSLDNGHQFLVTLSDQYLNEKDLDGAMVEQLDLKLLLSAQLDEFGKRNAGDLSKDEEDSDCSDEDETETGEGVSQSNAASQLTQCEVQSPVLLLTFDYWKKDRRQRKYVMEDQENAQHFLDLLQPFLDAKNRLASMKEMFQCLKCNKEFAKLEAKVKVKKFEESKSKKGGVGEIFTCPFCESEHVVELEVSLLATEVKDDRVGSFSSTGSAPGPLATSTAPNTPQRPTAKRDIGLNQACKSSPNSSFMSAIETTPRTALQVIAAGKQLRLAAEQSPNASSNADYSTATEGSGSRSSGSRSFEGESKASDLHVKLYDTQESVSICKVSSIISKADGVSSVTLTSGNHSNMSTPRGATSLSTTSDGVFYDERETDQTLTSKGNLRTMCEPSENNYPPSTTTTITQNFGRQHSSSSRSRLASGDSDISVISNPSQSSIAVLDSSGTPSLASSSTELDFHAAQRRTSLPIKTSALDDQVSSSMMTMSTVAEASPSGSLLTSTCSSMVDSMYERALQGSPKKPTVLGELEQSPSSERLIHQETNRTEEDADVEIVKDDGPHSLQEGSLGVYGHGDHQNDQVSNAGINEVTSQVQSAPPDQQNLTSLDSMHIDSSRDSVVMSSHGVMYNYEDFTQVDHRLKLYLTMSVIQDNEEIQCVLKTSVLQFPKSEEFQGLLLVTSERILIIRIIKESSEKLEGAMKVVDQQPVTELQYVDIGLGHQAFRLEFNNDGSCYTFLLRDENRCKRFLALFIGIIQTTAFYKSSKLKGISKNNIDTISSIKTLVLAPLTDGDATYGNNSEAGHGEGGEEEGEDEKQSNLKFFMGYLGGSGGEEPVSVIISGKEICVCHQTMELPLPRLQVAPGDMSKKRHFELKDKQAITDLLEVFLDAEEPNKITLHFLNEETNDTTDWHVTMETTAAVQSLIKAIKLPWEHQMCVELEITYT